MSYIEHNGDLRRSFKAGELTVKIYETTRGMGMAAAAETSACIRELLSQKEEINMIFAAAPSQLEFLAHLTADPSIDWTRVNAFHMDEYIGIGGDAPQSFANFLVRNIFGKLPFKSVNLLDGKAASIEDECARYSALLEKYPVDIVCLGIGENGHIAFNDPPVADFNDPFLVKVVDLDGVCRQQQVNEKCFESLDLVPKQAMTLTVPALMRAEHMFCIVPFTGKAKAVKACVCGEISEKCPSSILRTKKDAILYLNSESSSLL